MTPPSRIVITLPCCIGDVILGTAALAALRAAYPTAHIAWAVGSWSRPVLENHPLLDELIDTGPSAAPLKLRRGMWDIVQKLRAGRFDLLVSLDRSPLWSVAALMSGIPVRAGLDSQGRGFGYTHKAKVDPNVVRHEAQIYLDVIRALGLDAENVFATVPVQNEARESVRSLLQAQRVTGRYMVLHPGGGRNPGMTFDAKRPPTGMLALLMTRVSDSFSRLPVVVVGGPDDGPILEELRPSMYAPMITFDRPLTFAEVGALAAGSVVYIGSDTGMTHLAAAVGAPTVALFGPTDPGRYAPFGPRVLTLWKRTNVDARGVSSGAIDWNWWQDAPRLEVMGDRIFAFLEGEPDDR